MLLYGLIGAGIQGSRSPALHEQEAREQGLQCRYKLIDIDVLGLGIEALAELLNVARRDGFVGVNVTHPFKQAVLPLLDELSGDARSVQ